MQKRSQPSWQVKLHMGQKRSRLQPVVVRLPPWTSFLIDSWASNHMVAVKSLLFDLKNIPPVKFTVGNSQTLLSTQSGSLDFDRVQVYLVLLVLGIKRNLISVSATPLAYQWEFSPFSATLRGQNGQDMITGQLKSGLYTFQASTLSASTNVAQAEILQDSWQFEC